MNHIELIPGTRQNKYEHAHRPCQPQKCAQTLETTTLTDLKITVAIATVLPSQARPVTNVDLTTCENGSGYL